MVTWPVGSGNGRRPRGGWPSWASAPLPPGAGSPPEKTCCGRRTTYRSAADFLLDNPADNPEVAALYALLEDAGFDVLLVNARHVKNILGRKTDVADATWLAQLGAHGLVRASFMPPEPIRQLRDLTRARTAITRQRSREVQRLEKLLEDAGIKLSAVASDILGVSGRAMLESLIAGNRDPAALATTVQDPGVDRGFDRSVHRPSRVLGPGSPGSDRPAHGGHR
jgi:Transposase